MGSIGPKWRKSSRSSSNGNCVEARGNAGGVEVRDSKDVAGPVLAFGGLAWRGFVQHVKARDVS